MNYYSHHIGDYRRDTAHLSLLEHGVYRQLLDLYYLHEKAIPKETEWVFRRLSAKTEAEQVAIQTVLSDFFDARSDGWHHKRCDMELREYAAKADVARENGKLGGRPKKTQPVISGNPDATNGKANHEPLTTNHKPKTPQPPKGEPEGFAEFYAAYPRKEARASAAKAFGKVTAPLADLLAALAWQRLRNEWTKDGGKFIPLPASWLNAERWKDERPAAQPGDAPAWYETRAGVERKAASLGIGKWNEIEEQWPEYRARVMRTAKEKQPSTGFSIDQLAAMAAQRQAA